MARKVPKAPVSEIPDEDVLEEETEDDTEETPTTRGWSRGMSKAAAARAALAEGYYVPKQASAYIKHKTGIDISPQQFSAEKSRIKLRSNGATTFGPGGFLPFHGQSGGQRAGLSGDADMLEVMELIKPLIDQFGVDKVKRMVDLLGSSSPRSY